MSTKAKTDLHLVIREGGRKELGQKMLRAHLEQRYEDARALVDRIAYRASLRSVKSPERPVVDMQCHSADGDMK